MLRIVIFIYIIEENSTSNILKEKQMHAEKTPLQSSNSRKDTFALNHIIPSTDDFLNTGIYKYSKFIIILLIIFIQFNIYYCV